MCLHDNPHHGVCSGEMHMGGQEHFYLETNCTVAVPKGEDGEMELFVSTQAATKTQVHTHTHTHTPLSLFFFFGVFFLLLLSSCLVA